MNPDVAFVVMSGDGRYWCGFDKAGRVQWAWSVAGALMFGEEGRRAGLGASAVQVLERVRRRGWSDAILCKIVARVELVSPL